MLFRTAFALLLAAFGICSFTSPAKAELPPEVYASYQAKSPEALQIEVLTIRGSSLETRDAKVFNIEVTAKVTGVTRSASGLRAGSTITIRYQTSYPLMPIAGPSPVPVISLGQKCDGFLQRMTDGSYSPAARGYSFEKVETGPTDGEAQ